MRLCLSFNAVRRASVTVAAALVAPFITLVLCGVAATSAPGTSWAAGLDALPILARHANRTREDAAQKPRSEKQQAVVQGWPLYRTNRGQDAFNQAMATLKATDVPPPPASAFAPCPDLTCKLALPRINADGWLSPGRLWLSPDTYVVIVKSPRPPRRRGYRRHSKRNMRVFVYHEFHNSTRNTDVYDTISAHRGSVFVSFYLSKPQRDAYGRQFVVLVQAAPHNVVSRHARNHGNRGPGVEVAKNFGDPLAPLQSKAGVLLGAMVAAREPQLRMVHHRGSEGRAMRRAYEAWRTGLKGANGRTTLRLPFTPATSALMANAKAPLAELIQVEGAPRLVVATAAPLEAPARPARRPQRQPARALAAASSDAPPVLNGRALKPLARPKPARVARLVDFSIPGLDATPAPQLVSAGRLLTPFNRRRIKLDPNARSPQRNTTPDRRSQLSGAAVDPIAALLGRTARP